MASNSLKELLQSATLSPSKFPARKNIQTSSNLIESIKLTADTPNATQTSFQHKEAQNSNLKFIVDSLCISQVKHSKQNISKTGKLIAASRNYIYYVVNAKKIRAISQENAITGLFSVNDTDSLPIVDICCGNWSKNKTDVIATLSNGGQICIGYVQNDDEEKLSYIPLLNTTFPELKPAKKLCWSDDGSTLIAVGNSSTISIIELKDHSSICSSQVITSNLNFIQEVCVFKNQNDTNSSLFIASNSEVEIYSSTSNSNWELIRTSKFPVDFSRIWFLNHISYGILIFGITDKNVVYVNDFKNGLFFEIFTVESHIDKNGNILGSFDRANNFFCLHLENASVLLFDLSDLNNTIYKKVIIPSDSDWISLFCANSLNDLNISASSNIKSEICIYTYHADSVSLHKIRLEENIENQSVSIDSTTNSKLDTGDLVKDIMKGLNKLTMDQSKKFRKEAKEQELIQNRRHQELLSLAIKNIQESVAGNLKVIVEESLTTLISSHLDDQLTATISKLFDKKVNELFSRHKIVEVFDQTIEKNINERLTPALLSGISQINDAFISSIGNSILSSVDKKFDSFESELREVKDLLASPKISNLEAQNVVQVKNEYQNSLEYLESGRPDQAILSVLSMGNLESLESLLEKIDPTIFLDDPAFTLDQSTLLSLIQQLGADFSNKSELKLIWLAEVLTVFNPMSLPENHQEDALTVLEDLFANLRVFFTHTTSSSDLQKQVKTVMRLTRIAMTSLN